MSRGTVPARLHMTGMSPTMTPDELKAAEESGRKGG
jgi:hypothetical protein